MRADFRSTFDIPPLGNSLHYQSSILAIGSCFTENITEKLMWYKFNTLHNPFGIIYNPVSLAEELSAVMKLKAFTEDDIFEENGVYKSFLMHSRISHYNKNIMLAMMNKSVEGAHSFLKKATHCIITFGTARIYRLKTNGEIAANNHKQPGDKFFIEQLRVEETVVLWKELITRLKEFNPELQMIFTVSPVRHFRDGAVENANSKAILITVVHELLKADPALYYFPAYEIMMDDLRDYRFYAPDMFHPNDVAIDYIFQKFKAACIHPGSFALMDKIGEIKTAMQHKPFFPALPAHHQFKMAMLQKVLQLQRENITINFQIETDHFQSE